MEDIHEFGLITKNFDLSKIKRFVLVDVDTVTTIPTPTATQVCSKIAYGPSTTI